MSVCFIDFCGLIFAFHRKSSGKLMVEQNVIVSTIKYLEHVVFRMNLSFDNSFAQGRRGDIQVELTSPHGTTSVLLPFRSNDDDYDEGFPNWPFMSVHFWGENPNGIWTLNITYKGNSGATALIPSPTLTFFGTATKPPANVKENCHSNCARSCAAGGSSIYCDSCKKGLYRNAVTLDCVEECPTDLEMRSGYCYNSSGSDAKCVRPTDTCTCPSSATSRILKSGDECQCSDSSNSNVNVDMLTAITLTGLVALCINIPL